VEESNIDGGRERPDPTDAAASAPPADAHAGSWELKDATASTAADAESPAPLEAGPEAGPPAPDASKRDPDAGAIRRVFVTSARYTAALGGPAGADALCRAHAQDGDLRGEYRAWLSTATIPAAERLLGADVPYVRLDGMVVATGWADLVDGALLSPIAIDEHGATVFDDVWTGTHADGTGYPDDCAGFTTDGTGIGLCGTSYRIDETWTENLVPGCGTPLRLFCFEQ
jgi:hypothetical protein